MEHESFAILQFLFFFKNENIFIIQNHKWNLESMNSEFFTILVYSLQFSIRLLEVLHIKNPFRWFNICSIIVSGYTERYLCLQTSFVIQFWKKMTISVFFWGKWPWLCLSLNAAFANKNTILTKSVCKPNFSQTKYNYEPRNYYIWLSISWLLHNLLFYSKKSIDL